MRPSLPYLVVFNWKRWPYPRFTEFRGMTCASRLWPFQFYFTAERLSCLLKLKLQAGNLSVFGLQQFDVKVSKL